MTASLDALSSLAPELETVQLDAATGAGPLAYAACVALCAWWMGPPCLIACIPLFVAPTP